MPPTYVSLSLNELMQNIGLGDVLVPTMPDHLEMSFSLLSNVLCNANTADIYRKLGFQQCDMLIVPETSRFVLYNKCGLVLADFSHIIQVYFFVTGAIMPLP